MPDAELLGWVDHGKLPGNFTWPPSSCSVALRHVRMRRARIILAPGRPLFAYLTKGPKEIIYNGLNGYLVKNKSEMALRITGYLGDKTLRDQLLKVESLKRAKDYDLGSIITSFLHTSEAAALAHSLGGSTGVISMTISVKLMIFK